MSKHSKPLSEAKVAGWHCGQAQTPPKKEIFLLQAAQQASWCSQGSWLELRPSTNTTKKRRLISFQPRPLAGTATKHKHCLEEKSCLIPAQARACQGAASLQVKPRWLASTTVNCPVLCSNCQFQTAQPCQPRMAHSAHTHQCLTVKSSSTPVLTSAPADITLFHISGQGNAIPLVLTFSDNH